MYHHAYIDIPVSIDALISEDYKQRSVVIVDVCIA